MRVTFNDACRGAMALRLVCRRMLGTAVARRGRKPKAIAG